MAVPVPGFDHPAMLIRLPARVVLVFALGLSLPSRAEPAMADTAALAAVAPGLRAELLDLGLRAYERARRAGHARRELLSIIDFSLPSSERRLWVFDVARRVLLFHERVAHGRGSGLDRAERFSNVPFSHQSSIGAFVTAETYLGKHGRSLRLDGLEPGINDAVRRRAVVVHAADYVGEAFVRTHGRAGRSQGCPALDPAVAMQVIDAIAGGSVLWAYAPDDAWLARSTFLAPAEPLLAEAD
jgi:hypothetical protein